MNYGLDWKEQSKKALIRDNFKCRFIDLKGIRCNLETNIVHHLRPFHISHDNSLSNLISLCKKHHGSAENSYRRLGFTRFVEKIVKENMRLSIEKDI